MKLVLDRMAQRARNVLSATTSTAYILCLGQVDLSIWVVMDQHPVSATRHGRRRVPWA